MKTNALHLETIDRLVRLSETDLQRKIIEPLLRKEGFTSVRQTGGPNDKGKDLTALKDDFGKPKLYGIQIKRFKFSGKHDDPKGLANVITQLKQIFSEPVKDPLTRTERYCDRCLFITPYEIHRDALESAFRAMAELERKEITIIDGPILVDMITKHVPSALEAFGIDLHYRYRLAEMVNKIPESSAFGLTQELELRNLYVDVDLTNQGLGIVDVAHSDKMPAPKHIFGTPSEFEEFSAQCRSWDCHTDVFVNISENPALQAEALAKKKQFAIKRDLFKRNLDLRIRHLRDKQKRTDAEIEADAKVVSLKQEISYFSTVQARYADIRGVVKAVREQASVTMPPLYELNNTSLSVDKCTATFRKAIAFANRIDDLNGLSIIQVFWADLWKRESKMIIRYPQINTTTLLKLRIPIFIRGGAGAGKTTFLRHICQQYDLHASKTNTPVPILISLVQASIKSQRDIIEQCLKRLRDLSYPINESELEARLQRGGFRLLFDGLDETGDGAEIVFSQIKQFSKEHLNLPIIVTGRDSYSYSRWADAAQFRVAPFTSDRLNLFIQNWFTSEPSKVDTIISWLSSNKTMREAACTPIIAALLCSLVDADADLPSTEVELYEQRFELLLGRWEKAKRGTSMSATLRKRYWHFITFVAYSMHIETRRTIDYAQLLKTAEAFYEKHYHGNADNLIKDCVHRNVLFQEPENQFSFGHLTYQEFLVAKHFANDNPIDFILHRVDQPWWSKTLEFYAAMKGDITSLLMKALVQHRSDEYLKKLIDLCSYASFTPKEAYDRVMAAYTRITYWK